jgi:hypothetical protein
MAKKEPETIDRYRIFAETSMEQMGFVLAALTRMGLQNISYELITDVNRFKTKERKVHEVSAEDLAAAFVKENARFKSSDLVAHFKAAGREATSAYYGIKKLTDANVIRKSVGGEFVRVEALPAPAKAVKTRPANPVRRFEVLNKDLIADAIKGRKQFTMAELRDVFAKEGRNEKSISPILTGMIAAKRIKAVSPGQYLVLAKPVKLTAEQRRENDKLRKQAKRDAAKKKATEAPAPAHNAR